MLDVMAEHGLYFPDFIKGYMLDDMPNKAPQSRRVKTVANLLRDADVQMVMQDVGISDNVDPVKEFHTELDSLIGKPGFDCYQAAVPVDDVSLTDAQKELERLAPSWVAFLESMMSNTRQNWRSYNRKCGSHINAIQFVTDIVLRQRARKRSNHLIRKLGYIYEAHSLMAQTASTPSSEAPSADPCLKATHTLEQAPATHRNLRSDILQSVLLTVRLHCV